MEANSLVVFSFERLETPAEEPGEPGSEPMGGFWGALPFHPKHTVWQLETFFPVSRGRKRGKERWKKGLGKDCLTTFPALHITYRIKGKAFPGLHGSS